MGIQVELNVGLIRRGVRNQDIGLKLDAAFAEDDIRKNNLNFGRIRKAELPYIAVLGIAQTAERQDNSDSLHSKTLGRG